MDNLVTKTVSACPLQKKTGSAWLALPLHAKHCLVLFFLVKLSPSLLNESCCTSGGFLAHGGSGCTPSRAEASREGGAHGWTPPPSTLTMWSSGVLRNSHFVFKPHSFVFWTSLDCKPFNKKKNYPKKQKHALQDELQSSLLAGNNFSAFKQADALQSQMRQVNNRAFTSMW